MRKISPEEHMVLLNRAWHHGIDQEVTMEYVYEHMYEMRKKAEISKSGEYVKGFTKAMNFVTILLASAPTFEEFATKEGPDA